MKRSFGVLLVACVLGGFGIGVAPSAANAATTKRPPAPTKKEAIRFMLQHGDVRLDVQSCASVKDPEDRTLTDYLSRVLAAQTDPTIRWYTGVRSKPLGGPGDRWQVDLRFYGSDTDDTYDMGIRFTMDRVARVIVPASVMCTGTS